MNNFTPVESLIGGILIGLASLGLFLGIGRIAGISGIWERGLFLWERSDSKIWTFWFIIGLVLGGQIVLSLGYPAFGNSHPHSLLLIGIGGLLVGIGSRMGSGCTSGHGVCGLGRLSLRSLVAVLTFMAAAFITLIIKRYIL